MHVSHSNTCGYLPVIGVYKIWWDIYLVGSWSPFIIGLHYDDPLSFCSWQFSYKNEATTNKPFMVMLLALCGILRLHNLICTWSRNAYIHVHVLCEVTCAWTTKSSLALNLNPYCSCIVQLYMFQCAGHVIYHGKLEAASTKTRSLDLANPSIWTNSSVFILLLPSCSPLPKKTETQLLYCNHPCAS